MRNGKWPPTIAMKVKQAGFSGGLSGFCCVIDKLLQMDKVERIFILIFMITFRGAKLKLNK